MLKINKHFGFTLAEVLVTLGIIGVVSAMTIPSLVKNYQRQVYVTQLRKVYNEVGQAVQTFMTDNRLVSMSESRLIGNKTALENFVNNYFKIAKNCNGRYVGCFASSYAHMDGSDDTSLVAWECDVTATLPSGAAICLSTGLARQRPADSDVNGDGNVNEDDVINDAGAAAGAVISIEVDINGTQGPNIYGRDLFFMDVRPNGDIVASPGDESYLGQIIDDGWEMTY